MLLVKVEFRLNPLHPNINMHILRTVLYTFPKVLTRRIWYNNQVLLWLVIISFFSCDLDV